MIVPYNGKAPDIGQDVFIAPTAVIIGDVQINDGASIWFHTVIRADSAPIVIGEGTNIQDNCTLHTDPGLPLTIGSGVTVGHNAVVHGCGVEDHVLIGLHATILNHAVIKTGSVVAAGAMVREGQQVGPFQLVAGIPAIVKKDFNQTYNAEIIHSEAAYRELAKIYLTMLMPDAR